MLLSNTAGQTYRTFSVIMIFGPLVQALVPVNRAPFYFIFITRGGLNTAAKRTAHEYKFELPVNYAFPVTY